MPGFVEYTNLELKVEALNAFQLPVTVKAGIIGKLTVKVLNQSLSTKKSAIESVVSTFV